MFKKTIIVDANIDVAKTIDETRASLAGIKQDLPVDVIADQLKSVVTQFLEQGTRLKSIGSTLSASQRVEGEGYSITVSARFGQKQRSWSRRLVSALFRQDDD